ncbi:MAG: hypothetical protein AMXMBFR84_25070 [Candidatus Hydrogenedentota bacterium]
MKTIHDVQRLCESWWKRFEDSARNDYHRCVDEFLKLLDWPNAHSLEPVALPGAPSSISFVVRSQNCSAVLATFAMPGNLEPPGSLVKRNLDFSPATRQVVDRARLFGAPYAFVTDLCRFYLYDARTDELLIFADSPQGFVYEFGDVLTRMSLEAGGLDEVRRQPRSFAARQLREWAQRWHELFTVEWRVSEETAWLAIDRLFVLRYFMDHDILSRPGWNMRHRFEDVMDAVTGQTQANAGRVLSMFFESVYRQWQIGLFQPDPQVEALMEQESIAAPLLLELGLLSRSKFTIPTILESFNFGDAAEKARVRMIPEENEERRLYLSSQSIPSIDQAKLQLDLADEGYRAIPFWMDRLLEVYDRLSMSFEAAGYPGHSRNKDMDLFDWSAMAASRPSALTDRFEHAVEHALVLYCASPRQFRTARLMMYLHLIDYYENGRVKFNRFPRVEKALCARPAMTEADRRRIYSPQRGEVWEVM